MIQCTSSSASRETFYDAPASSPVEPYLHPLLSSAVCSTWYITLFCLVRANGTLSKKEPDEIAWDIGRHDGLIGGFSDVYVGNWGFPSPDSPEEVLQGKSQHPEILSSWDLLEGNNPPLLISPFCQNGDFFEYPECDASGDRRELVRFRYRTVITEWKALISI